MPLFFQKEVDSDTRLAIWQITEYESFFEVPLQYDIRHPHKRLQHLAGRYLLKHLFPDFPVELIQIADTKKPYLENEAYHFSISHCGDYAAAIVSQTKRVGIDIEETTERVLRIKNKFLSTEELRCVQPQIDEKYFSEKELMTLLWSCKEAVFKWWSFGGVDFSEMIQVGSIDHVNSRIDLTFTKQKKRHLQARFSLFNGLVLCWVCT